jgi:AraC-like DNA-binding protein
MGIAYMAYRIPIQFVRPAVVLQEFIECYYLAEFIGSQNTPEFQQKPVSNGCEIMFIGYDNTNNTCFTNSGTIHRFDSGIVGAHDLKNSIKGLVMEPGQKTCKFISIKFKPGGFYRIFRIPSSKFFNMFLDVSCIIGNETNDLREQLADSKSYRERSNLLDLFFINKLRKNSLRSFNISAGFRIASYIRNHVGNIKISQLMDEFHITERTLERDFKTAFGLSPKEYCKILRFNSLLNYISMAKSVDWLDMVNQFGYYDQPHLIHEFKNVLGITPDLYFMNLNKTIFKIDNHVVTLPSS